jgi:hypothetical protein
MVWTKRGTRREERSMRDEKKLWIIRGVVAAIGLGLLAPAWKDILLGYGWSGPWSESVGGLLRGIGEAVVVALVLEWLVDAPAKQRLMGETMHATIIQAASKFLADKLSDQIFQYIEEKLLRIKLVRRSWNITYRISMVPGHNDDYVKLETESEYKMANTAPSQTTYDAVYRVEKSLVPVGTTSIDEVTVRNLLQIPPHDPVFHYPDTTNKAEDVPQPDEDSIVFKKAFQIPVHTATSAFQFVFKSTEYFHVGQSHPSSPSIRSSRRR